jgi:hypothetical protein
MARTANDHFKEYFTERLWEWIPAIYREEDGLAENPGVLRSLIELFADQAAVLRRSQDHLWDDQFIDLCQEWAVPYLGDLVGTRLVSALNARGRRIDVAKTIYYRRRKGTVRVVEELIGDITGWEGKVVEGFRRLGRARHGLDPAPGPYVGPLTGTPPGGFADLRNPRGSVLAGSAFDEYAHTADMRQDGRYAIPKLAFHLYRVGAWEVHGVIPVRSGDPSQLVFDPSGRDIPLYQPRQRAKDFEQWRTLHEWEVPAPMLCPVLADEQFIVTVRIIADLRTNFALSDPTAGDLKLYVGVRFMNEERFRRALQALPNRIEILGAVIWPELRRSALAPDCGHAGLLPIAFEIESAVGIVIRRERIAAGNLELWTGAPADRDVIVDPARGRVLFLNAPPADDVIFNYFYGALGQIGAGVWDRSPDIPTLVLPAGGGAIAAGAIPGAGIVEIADSATYTPIADVTGITALTIQAADEERPYLRAAGPELLLDSTGATGATLTLDGLWIGADVPADLVLDGDYATVSLRFVTLDPGGIDAEGNAIGAINILIRGVVDRLEIRSSVIAGIAIEAGATLEEVLIEDSIVSGDIKLPFGHVTMRRVTMLGVLDVDQLRASETLLTAVADVTDTQNGCFRFSSAPPGSRVPHPYESYFYADSAAFFVSRRFGDPGYLQLSEVAPDGLQRGAEDTSEIGVYSSLHNPIRLDSLKQKVDEYSPFGLIPMYVFET